MAEQSMMRRVAAELATQFGLVWSQMSDAPFSDGVDDHLSRPFWLEMARAAIEAMRDADGDMYLAADELKDITFDGVWHAMIDAALKD